MITESELQDILDESAAAWWARLRLLYPSLSRTVPAIVPNRRLKRTIARAWVDRNPQIIDYSVSIALKNVGLFKSDIIPHELAHLIAASYHGDQGHGKAWKNLMRELGLTPRLTYAIV